MRILERFAVADAADWPEVPWAEHHAVLDCIRERTEFGAVSFDRAVYRAADNDPEGACDALRIAGEISPEFLAAAQQDAVLLEQLDLLAETIEPLARATKCHQARMEGQLERAQALRDEAGGLQLDVDDADLVALDELADRLAVQLTAPAPLIDGLLILNDMLLDHIEQLVLPARRKMQQEQQEAEEERVRRERANALLIGVELAAHEFAASLAGARAKRTGRFFAFNGVDIPVWEITQPGSFLLSEKKWHVSIVDGLAQVVRYY